MSFTFDPTTDRGKIRLLIDDTASGSSVFADNEIDAFLENNSDSIWLAAAEGCRVRAAKLISSSINIEIPGAIKLDQRKKASYWTNLAEKYEARATGSVDTLAEYWDSFDIDVDQLGQDVGEYVGDV